MDASSKQTALFFGFITAAMTAASAQAAPASLREPTTVVEVKKTKPAAFAPRGIERRSAGRGEKTS